MHRIAFLILSVLAVAFAPIACKSTARDLRNIESLDDVRFGNLQAKAAAIVSLGLGPIVRRGDVSADDLAEIADVLDALAAGVLSPGPGGLVSDALRREGLTDTEIVGVFLLVEDALSELDIDLGLATPGPRAAALLSTLADTVRGLVLPDPDPETASS